MSELKKQDKHHGRQTKQRLKPYIVLQYLLRNTDENHFATGKEIEAYLQENCKIYAERRSIYKDIEEINEVNWMLENDADIFEAEEAIESDEYDEEKLVHYQHKKGFYIQQRHFELDDIRLLAECVNSAKFVSESQAKKLIDVVCDFVSRHQAEKIKGDAFVIDRVKTKSTTILNSVSVINDAMSSSIDGEKHEPEKISFKYLKYSINDMNQKVEQRKGEKYIVSPFKLIVNEGNYYLLAFDDKSKRMRTYRVDRMKNVSFTFEPREGEEEFRKMNIESFVKRTFSMFSGKTELVTIRFPNHLLDSVVERFGKTDASYCKVDEKHFTVMTKVDISEPFYGWLSSFGKRAKLIAPENVVEDYKSYLGKLKDMYESH